MRELEIWGSQALYSAEHLSQLEPDVITYIVARLPYSIFQIRYIFQPNLLHMRCWDEQFLMDHYYISGLLYSPMSELSLRTLKFEDRCSHLYHYRAVIDAQFYISSFSLDKWCLKWIILHDYDLTFYCVMVIIALILIFVTCIYLWYHDLAVIIIWTWLYLVLCIDVPT